MKKTSSIRLASKKLLSLCMVLILLLSVAIPNTFALIIGSYEETEDGFAYSISEDNTAKIKGYLGTEKDLVIPSEIEGVPVVSIHQSAFRDDKNIESVVLPDSITHIDDTAFAGCTNLKSIKLSSNLKEIEGDAFKNTALESIVIPASLEKVEITYYYDSYGTNTPMGPFSYCKNLTSITFEEGTTRTPDNVLAGCNNLTEVVLPQSVTAIGKGTFEYCKGIETLVIPEHITNVDSMAFYGCTSLKSVVFEGKNTKIGSSVFARCTALTDITLPAELKVINSYTFSDCTSLDKISLPETITSIGNNAFEDCETLKEIVIPQNVTSIGKKAFGGCYALERINLPESLTSLGEAAFTYCENLTTVQFADNSVKEIKANTFSNCYALENVTLPYGLESIGEKAFAEDRALKNIEIPETVTYIAENAFYRFSYESEDIPTADELTVYSDSYSNSEFRFTWKEIPEADCYDLVVTTEENGEIFRITTKEAIAYMPDNCIEDFYIDDNTKIYTAVVTAYDKQGNELSYTDTVSFRIIFSGLWDGLHLIGDANSDYEVNIKDATLIQRYCAGLTYLNRYVCKYVADTDNDATITVKDATMIQKYCAGLITERTNIGEYGGGGGVIWLVEYVNE